MAKLNWRTIGWLTLTALPMAAAAQFTFNATGDPNTAPQNVLGGTPAFDLIHLGGLGPGIPLRKGNVMPGSERVQLDNQVLQSGSDYGMDYAAGVVYVKRAIKPGMALSVFYRYDPKAAPASATPHVNGIAIQRFDLLPGGQFAVLAGLGMAERNADGSIASSNVFGFNSNFSVGSTQATGLFLFSQKKKVNSEQQMGYQAPQAGQPLGNSDLILQNLSAKAGKGSIDASYQDISKNFTDFGSALAAGYDAKVVDQMAKEKGLKRLGFGMSGIQVGSLELSQSFKSVTDGQNQLDWKSFGLKQGGFDFNYKSQYVSKGFRRFNDLSEADRAQLAKEAGMSRQSVGADFTEKFGKLSFTDNSIQDGSGSSINRKELAFDNSKFKFRMGDQTVGEHFSRIGSVLPAEQGMYGAELGVHRQWMALDATLDKNLQPVHFAMTDLSTKTGSFRSEDFCASGKTWSLEHSDRDVSQGFASFAALAKDAPEHVRAISNMYQKEPIALRPQDTQIFLSTPGISRDFTRFTATPMPGLGISAQRLAINTGTSASYVDTASLTSKHINFSFRKESLGLGLNPNSLLLFERDRLGTLPGLDRTDMSLSMDLGGSKTLAITQTDATVGAEDMSRRTAEYRDKKIDVQAGMRNVSPGAVFVTQLVDPEQKFLGSLTGFKERDFKVSWQILPNMKLDAYSFDASSDSLSQEKKLSNLLFNWKPDKTSDISYFHYENHNYDPTAILFANVIDRFTLCKDFGKLGKFSYLSEKQSNDGSQTTLPGSEKQSFAYEAQIGNRTSLKTEETTTKFDNGEHEDTSTQTISTALTKQVGVSVSDVKIDRPGTAQDQNKRNYGFWVDFGHGLRFNYGYARQLDGSAAFEQNQMSLTGGQVGDWKLGGGSFANNYWDATDRTQSTTQFALGTVKPIRLGFLRDVTMNLGWDTAADRSIWLKENKLFSFSGKLGGALIGFDYHSQILQTNLRGIDRVFTLRTDPNEQKWLRANVFYKVRTLPSGQQIMIRNMSTTARLMKGVEITNSLLTNPEQPNAGVLLGSVPLADRKNSWKLEYKPTGQQNPYRNQYTYGANWDELINDQNKTLTRTGGATFKINFGNARSVKADDPTHSSLTLYYGLEQNDTTAMRRLAQRYSIGLDQRPGPNQMMNLVFGNVSYEHSIADGFHRDNWQITVNYQLKF